MCIRQTATSDFATISTAPIACSARTSLIIDAPAAIAARITTGFIVSTEINAPSRASASTIGMMRSISSASEVGSAPGRVDSPPMSTMSAPSASIDRACPSARSKSRKRPPSENESGVTLSTPITRGRERSSAWRPQRSGGTSRIADHAGVVVGEASGAIVVPGVPDGGAEVGFGGRGGLPAMMSAI